MKKSLMIFLVLIFTFVSCFCLNSFLSDKKAVNSEMKTGQRCIVIDAGHGGVDAGTSSADGTAEKDINLAIALDLYDFLNICGIDCKLIREDDTEFYPNGEDRSRSDLYNRLDYVNSVENAVLVSIHQNHFSDSGEWGMQVWYTANVPSSKKLADNILNNTKMFIQPDNTRSNKQSDDSYYILYKASVPSVMVECGFMSNPQEVSNLESSAYRKRLTCTITLGITQYLNEGEY